MKLSKAVSVEWNLLLPLCSFEIFSLWSRKITNCECAVLSPTLNMMERRDIGHVLEGSSGSPDLRIGMTSANFHTILHTEGSINKVRYFSDCYW